MNIKVLELNPWMKKTRGREECLADAYYQKSIPIFNRPGKYLQGDICWFELGDGRAFTYNREYFEYELGLLKSSELLQEEILALGLMINTKIITKKQKEIYSLYIQYTSLRNTDRWMKKRVISFRKAKDYEHQSLAVEPQL